MPGSKKDKKNGKTGGGLISALAEHSPAKYSESARDSSASPSLAPAHSPDIRAIAPSSNGNFSTSPLLDAVSATTFAATMSPTSKDWTKGALGGMAGSPGNLISLMGESPPTLPSSYEDPRLTPYGWASPMLSAGQHPPSVSPPKVLGRRPLSFQMEGHYSPPDLHGQAAAAVAGTRRSSIHSHYAQARATSHPPLPHQPQPHFYGVPDIDIDVPQQAGMRAGERGYFFGFDTLPSMHADALPGKDDVVLAGFEGGLEIYSVGRSGLDHVTTLSGLRGGVYHAKILPWSTPASNHLPMVAVVVYGPVLPSPPLSDPPTQSSNESTTADPSAASLTNSPDARNKVGSSLKPAPGVVEAYQTAVEIYCLRTHKRIETLMEAPKVPIKAPITSPIFKPPQPSGAFQIKADGGNLVVSSGVTGECWIYRHQPVLQEGQGRFYCAGKLWTTLQHPPREDGLAEGERGGATAGPAHQRSQCAIASLNGKWLAYCPATPSSQVAIRASVLVPPLGKAPGLSSMTPPLLPPVTSEIDMPLSESVVNRLMRDATQELIQGAKWVGKQGLQAWNNYWNASGTTSTRSPPLPAGAWSGMHAQRQDASQFPPTHATVTPPIPKDPGIICVVDLETLPKSPSAHPLTTFSVPHGCSFLSFAPSGLSLFTASAKGDVQTVLDLMRIQYTRASVLQATVQPLAGGPRPRQIAQFSRMTVARIVDVVWTKPNGERAAMVTERGTVHLLDLPSGAFTWPPPRQRMRTDEKDSPASEEGSPAVALASNALSSVRDVARPLISRQRRSSTNAPQVSGATFVDHAAHGRKVIAASISHSLGKTGSAINQLRYTGDNRVSLPNTATSPGPSCVVWKTGRKGHYLYVLGDGLVRTFPTKSRRTLSGEDKQRVMRLARYKDFRLRDLPSDLLAPCIRAYLDRDEYIELTDRELDAGDNTMGLPEHRLAPSPHDAVQSSQGAAESSIPQAEIESSAPYQPFHTDRRVALYEYGGMSVKAGEEGVAGQVGRPAPVNPDARAEDAKASHGKQSSSGQPKVPPAARWSGRGSPPNLSAWVFGQPVQAVKLDLGNHHGMPEGDESLHGRMSSEESRALPASAIERVLHRVVGGGSSVDDAADPDGAQIVVTTRRRRTRVGEQGEDDAVGFFEDDCEVLDFADQRV